MTTQNDLLDAVDALSLPRTSKVMQSNDAGIMCVTTINHDPRLQHLRSAIVGGIGSHAGGSNEPRLPFDAGSLALYTEIETAISTWFVDLMQKPVYLTPEQTLRQWYIGFHDAYLKGAVTDEERYEYTKTLRKWAHQIDSKFDPPRKLELMAPCPECGERHAFDPKSGDLMPALIVEYHEEGSQTVVNAMVSCRSCEAVWPGDSGCRSVAWSIEQMEKNDDQ